jgi:uncharacterized protein
MIFSHYQIRPLTDKNAPPTMPLSTDLGLTTVQVEQTPEGWRLPEGSVLTNTQIKTIHEDKNSCYRLIDNELMKVEAYSEYTNRYYSLYPTSKAPSMLISGIPMHRVKETTPVEDTTRKIQAVGRPYGLILDTATGLGYTALRAAKTAKHVITIEFDPLVLSICRINPWSQGLFSNPKIDIIIGNTADLVKCFQDSTFSAIIHDPPTFNMAGYLYSGEIYQSFFRILKSSGRMYHYIGDPKSRSGASIGRGVVDRLRQAGFTVMPKGRAFGVLAKK